MSLQMIASVKVAEAIGPYSHGLTDGRTVWTSGQIPLMAGGTLAGGGIAGQTRQALDNLTAVLEAGGATLRDVVKTTVYLQDMADFAAVNVIYAEYFADHKPARSTVQVAALPLGALIEVEATARVSLADE